MKTVYIETPRKVQFAERLSLSPSIGEIKLRVRIAGICASDKHIYCGTHPDVKYPLVPGRNFAGEVIALGADTHHFSIGDHVVVDPLETCGACPFCQEGHFNLCENLQILGFHKDGGMAEEIIIPSRNAYVIPKSWTWEKAIMVEPFAVAAHGLMRTCCTAKDRVLIIGSGCTGLALLLTAKYLGARVAVADVLDARLAVASSLGADLAINMNSDSFASQVREWTSGIGVSLSLDLLGLPDFFPLLQDLASPYGRIVTMCFSEKPMGLVPLKVSKKELTLAGARLQNGLFPKVIEWFAANAFAPESLISQFFPFLEAEEAFMLTEESPVNVTKVVLIF